MVREIKKAFVVGGFSESIHFLSPFTREICEGEYRIVDEAEPIPVADILANPENFLKESRRRLVVSHSFGAIAIREAVRVVMLNPVEPTPLHQTFKGALRVATNQKIGREPNVPQLGLTDPARELMRHPVINAKIPFWVRRASGLQVLINGGTHAFPGGQYYLPTNEDEFGFGRVEYVERALEQGIIAELLSGYHNQPLLHPASAVQHIYNLFEQNAA